MRGMGSAIGGTRGGGHRLGVTPGRGGEGDKVRFNPSLIDIDVLYNDYSKYITDNHYTNNVYTVPFNQTITFNINELESLEYYEVL